MRDIGIDQLYSEGRVIKEFRILYSGWELDGAGEIYEDQSGKRYLVLTNHGMPYIGSSDELREQIKEYQEVIVETQEAIRLLDEP